MLRKHLFVQWNANMKVSDLGAFAVDLSACTHNVWKYVSIMTTDESVFEWLGSQCPVRHYIPRKPHPNGLLAYGTCTWTYVQGQKMPVLVEIEPHHSPEQTEMSAQKSMLRLISRIREVLAAHSSQTLLSPHLPRRTPDFTCITLETQPLALSP